MQNPDESLPPRRGKVSDGGEQKRRGTPHPLPPPQAGRGIRVIFFDAGGTLFRPFPSVGEIYARVARDHGVPVDAAHVEKIFHEKWHERNGMVTLAGLSSEKIERTWWFALVRDVF